MGLADKPLVGGVDDNRASARLDYIGDSLTQSVDGAVNVCLHHQVEFLVGNVKQGVGPVDSGIGKHAVETAELIHGLVYSPGYLLTAACIPLDKKEAVRIAHRFHQFHGFIGVDIHKPDIPALLYEFSD